MNEYQIGIPSLPTPERPRTLTTGPLRPLAWLAIASIVASTLFSLLVAVMVFPMIEAVEAVIDQPAEGAAAADLEAALLGIAAVAAVGLLAWACAAGFFIAWLHRARVNLERAGVLGFSRSSGWVIGVWFIPFVNLVMPYWIVAEIADASDHRSRWWRPAGDAVSGRGLLIGWWLTWVGALVIDRVGSAMTDNMIERAATAQQLGAVIPIAVGGSAVTAALFIAAAVQVTMLILRVTRHQHDWTAADAAAGSPAVSQA